MKVINFIVFLITYFIGLIFRIFSYNFAHKVGYWITLFFFTILKKYKKIIYNNLQNAFPNKKKEFYDEIYKKNLKFVGKLLADTFLKPRMKNQWFEKHIIRDEEVQKIEKQIQEYLKNKEPIILISGHLGGWETLAQYLGYRFSNSTLIIYKKIKNTYLDKWLYKLRSITGANLYSMEDTLSVIRELEKGKLLAIAPDQNAGGAGIMINFLNRPASTYKGPVLIGYTTKAHLYFISLLYLEKGKFKIIYEYLGRIQNQTSKEEIIKEWTNRWVSTLEKYVKQYPDQYFWVHQRWKTTPEIMEKFQREKLLKRGILKE